MKAEALAPLIAVTTANHQHYARVNNRYLALASDFGGVPLMLHAQTSPSAAKALLERVHGLIIIGGQDLDSELYGQACIVQYDAHVQGAGVPFHRPLSLKPNRQRDDFELALYEAAIKQGIPVLGICRGLQLINVAEGGSLYQEIPASCVDHCAGEEGFVHHHPITIAPDSFAFKTLERDHYFTSSIHHQGIDRLGAKLKKAAWAADDAIEIIERIDDQHFVLGIHGHVEQTRKNLPLYDKMIAAFVARCALTLRECNKR